MPLRSVSAVLCALLPGVSATFINFQLCPLSVIPNLQKHHIQDTILKLSRGLQLQLSGQLHDCYSLLVLLTSIQLQAIIPLLDLDAFVLTFL